MKETIKLHDRTFRIMIPAEKIDEAVSAVARRINADYADLPTPLFVGVLSGSFMFMSDLIKKIEFNNELSFVKLASYEGTSSTGEVKSLIGLNGSIEGRHVIIVEDIVDTGESIEHMMRELEARHPASIEVCTLFFKPGSYRKQRPIKYRAMEIIDELEHGKRGLYTGSIGYLTLDGECDLNIVIRTALHRDGRYHLGVGGGITSESDLEFEYEETLQKAKAVLEALQ